MNRLSDDQEMFPVFEELEPRILLSGIPAPESADNSTVVEVDSKSEKIEPIDEINEIVSVDESVENHNELISLLDHNTEVFFSYSEEDGMARISNILADTDDVSAVHIISHGEKEQISFGNNVLSTDSLMDDSEHLMSKSGSLSVDADILIYICDVG